MTRTSPFAALDAASGPVLTTTARFIFAATLFT